MLDVSAFLPGPFCSILLADMGAEVLKIEPPAGDAMTELGPRDAAGVPIFYHAINAGKKVRVMDLKKPEVRAEFLQLVLEYDVLIEGFRPGAMARLGLDYAVLREINPGLVYCSISGYGASGPLAQAAGHDVNYLASAGVLHRNGGDMPVFFDPPIADYTGSLFGVISILGALNARKADGLGCEIDIGLADVIMPLQLIQVAAYGAIGDVPQPRHTYLNGGGAYYQVYATNDGRHVALGAIELKFWRAFCLAADRPDWMERHGEPLPQIALIKNVAAYFSSLSLSDCTSRFASPECCLSPILDLGEAVASPHHRERGLISVAPHGALQSLFPAYVNGLPPASRERLRPDGDNGNSNENSAF